MKNFYKGKSASETEKTAQIQLHASSNPTAIILFAILCLGSLAGDLLSKHYTFKSMLADDQLPQRVENLRRMYKDRSLAEPTARQMLHLLEIQRDIMPGVKFSLSTNPGVVFGLPMPRLLVAGITVFTIGLVIYFFATAPSRAYWTHSALAMILGGAAGNLYDRIFSKVVLPGLAESPISYHVRDFIDCSGIPLPFGFRYVWIFNLADVFLVVGVSILVVCWLFGSRRQKR